MSGFKVELSQGQMLQFSATRPPYVLYDQNVDVYEDGVKTAYYNNGVANAYVHGPAGGKKKKLVELSLWFDAKNGHWAGLGVIVTGSYPRWHLICHDSWGDQHPDLLVDVEIINAVKIIQPGDKEGFTAKAE